MQILVADDHEAVREGIRRLIERRSGWSICGTAQTGGEAVKQAEALQPDVVVLDMCMPGLDGAEATRQIKRSNPNAEVVIYTGLNPDDVVPQAVEAGAKTVVFKTEAASHLIEAIAQISRERAGVSENEAEALSSGSVASAKDQPAGVCRPLTSRERQTLQLLAGGKSNKEVAAALGVSLRTAEAHRASLLRKLGVNSFAGLVRYAVRNDIIEP